MTAVLELLGLVKTYHGARHDVPVLRGIDLTIEAGEFAAIVGPSGSGKSTLMNILGCLDRPTAGSYRFLGEDVAGLDDLHLSRLRNRHVGFVFQSFHLVAHLSVLENIELPLLYARVPRGERRSRALHLAERVGLGHRTAHWPAELSGGECQRVAIARALANDPALVLADEPTGNLDSRTRGDIMQAFLALHRAGSTIVMITHEEECARMAPRRIALRDGRVAADTRAQPEAAAP